MQIREAFYGQGHPLIAPSLEKQALLQLQAGRDLDATDLLQQSLEMQEPRCV